MRAFAIIPAAGHSQRMGRPKLLLPWGDGTVVDHVLAAWRASCVTAIVVVVRRDDIALAERCRAAGVSVVTPPVDPPDMKASVGVGLAFVRNEFSPTTDDVWLLVPADMPQLSAGVVDALCAAHDSAAPAILVPTWNGHRGHPVLFPWSVVDAVARLRSDEGLNALLHSHPVREVQCAEPAILEDLDTLEDYGRLRP